MAKIKAPLFSLDATGTLDKNITYKGKKQLHIAQKYSKPGSANPFESSPRQKDQRSIIRLITIHWQCMSSGDKLTWENAAKDVRFKGTGYHYFLHMAQQNLTQYLGLVGYWSMNYNVDDKIPDLSGNGNHGILSPIYPCDCPQPADSLNKKLGKALYFNGTTSYLNCGHDPSLAITDFITLQCLIKGPMNYAHPLIHKKHSYFLEYTTNGKFYVYLRIDGSWRTLYSTTSLPSDTWGLITLTYSYSTRTIHLYLNGEEMGGSPKTLTGLATYKINYNPSEDLTLAKYTTYFFPGIMDDVPIFNQVLSQAEIQRYYSLLI